MNSKFLVFAFLVSATITFAASSTSINSSANSTDSSFLQEIASQLAQNLQAAKTGLSQDQANAQDAENEWYEYYFNSTEYSYWGHKLSEYLTDEITDEELVNNLTLAQNVLNQGLEDIFNSTAEIYSAPSDNGVSQQEQLSNLESVESADDIIYNEDLTAIKGLQNLKIFINSVMNTTNVDEPALSAYMQQMLNVLNDITEQYSEVSQNLETIDSDISNIEAEDKAEEVSDISSQMEIDQAHISELNQQIEADESSIISLETELESTKGAQLATIQDKINAYESEVESATEEIQDLQRQVMDDRMRIEGIQCPLCQ